MAQHNDIGRQGEDLAAEYLVKKGYVIRERNYRVGRKDLDIVAMTEDMLTIVFVEVKTRSDDDVLDPADALDIRKMKNVGSCANAYIKFYNLDLDIRFDLITIVGTDGGNMRLNHVEDAFNPCLL